MNKILCVWLLLAMNWAHAQTIESRIYVCTSAAGQVRLHNLNPTGNCQTKVVRTPAAPTRQVISKAMSDPQPAANAVLVAGTVQARRDESRRQIVQSELSQAQQHLNALQAEYQNGTPERLGSEKNYQKYLERTQALKQNIQLTQDNIAALQRELSREP
ncbi:MAG: hypothetical protein ACRCV6_02785 [Formosimonas sp.]